MTSSESTSDAISCQTPKGCNPLVWYDLCYKDSIKEISELKRSYQTTELQLKQYLKSLKANQEELGELIQKIENLQLDQKIVNIAKEEALERRKEIRERLEVFGGQETTAKAIHQSLIEARLELANRKAEHDIVQNHYSTLARELIQLQNQLSDTQKQEKNLRNEFWEQMQENKLLKEKLNQLTSLLEICFLFVDSSGDVVCVRAIAVSNKCIEVYSNREPCHQSVEVTEVTLTITDFLYMYSGAATASEIASMCMSGRIKLNWIHFSRLKAFANSFDFSSEMWDKYYAINSNQSINSSLCKGSCCNIIAEELNKDWQVIRECLFHTIEDWEMIEAEEFLVTSLDLEDSSKERKHENEWKLFFSNILNGKKDLSMNRNLQNVQQSLQMKIHSLREYAAKLMPPPS